MGTLFPRGIVPFFWSNTMKKIILHYCECNNSGEFGLLIDGSNARRLYAATDGVLAAHDIIEHVNTPNDIGSISDELEALAVIWWVRGQFNDLRRDNVGSALSPYEHLAYDISHMADYICSGVASVPKGLKTHSCIYDDDFELILSTARQHFRHNMLDDVNTDIFRGVSNVSRYFDTVIHYMRRGYRKALKRYKNLGQTGANALFWNMATIIDTDLQYIEIGERLELCYSLTTGEVKTGIKHNSYGN